MVIAAVPQAVLVSQIILKMITYNLILGYSFIELLDVRLSSFEMFS